MPCVRPHTVVCKVSPHTWIRCSSGVISGLCHPNICIMVQLSHIPEWRMGSEPMFSFCVSLNSKGGCVWRPIFYEMQRLSSAGEKYSLRFKKPERCFPVVVRAEEVIVTEYKLATPSSEGTWLAQTCAIPVAIGSTVQHRDMKKQGEKRIWSRFSHQFLMSYKRRT